MSNNTKTNSPSLIQLLDQTLTELRKLQTSYVAAGASGTITKPRTPPAMEGVVTFLGKYPGSHRREIAAATRSSPATITKALATLQEQGKALHVGEKRGSRWFLTETLDSLTKPAA